MKIQLKKQLNMVMACIMILLSILQYGTIVRAADGDYILIASNKKYNLLFNKETANVKFEDIATGTSWTTFPEDWNEDTLSKGAVRENMASHLVMDVYGDKDNLIAANTYTHSVKKKTFTYDAINDGLAIHYNLKKLGIDITIEFHLTDTGFKIVIPPSKINEGENVISNISILPFLLSGDKGEDGYMFVPDGSGMLVDFRKNYGPYRNTIRSLYGRDYATNVPSSQLIEENYQIPVYGIKNEKKGVFAIIEKQDARASITTGIAGFMYNKFRNYCVMSYREKNEISVKNNIGIETKYIRWSKPISSDIVVAYYLLPEDKSEYSDMAAIYQDYLVKYKGLKKSVKNKASFDLTLIGSVKMRKSVLGIPMTTNQALTTFKEAEKIISSLQNRGVNSINIRYLGFNRNGYLNEWSQAIKPAANLGGTKGLKNLFKFADQNDINLFLSGELIQVYKPGNGFSINKNAVRTISNSVLQLFDYSIVTGNLLKGVGTRYLTSPSYYKRVFSDYIDEVSKWNTDSIAFEDIGSMLYSDYNKNKNITKDEAKDMVLDSLNLPSTIEQVMFSGGNEFVLGKATNLVNVPMSGSNMQISTEYVPFYQMVIHGYVNYSGKAFNYSNNRKKDMLKMIEYGANIHFIGIYKDSSILKNSNINHILSACYQDWIDEASEMYREISIAYDGIYNKRMIGHHKLAEKVYITEYEGGISIIVNYGADKYKYNDNIVVNGMDFMVVEGGRHEK